MLRKTSVQQKESEDQFNFTRHYVTSADRSFCINLSGYVSYLWTRADL